jgi:peptidoglycan hydrolase-like protein with peptidoglycan-binding domain
MRKIYYFFRSGLTRQNYAASVTAILTACKRNVTTEVFRVSPGVIMQALLQQYLQETLENLTLE